VKNKDPEFVVKSNTQFVASTCNDRHQ